MNQSMKQAMEARRSNYAMKASSSISDEEIEDIIKHALKHVPTAFNSQSCKVVLLYGEQHHKLWELTKNTLRPLVPEAAFKSTDEKINGFMAGYGTILYFDDTSITEGLEQSFELYKDNFKPWAQQTNGMLQYAIWTLLDEAGFAVNLQHYNPLIDAAVKETFDIPATWMLIAEMPFGDKNGPVGEKQFNDMSERFSVRK